METHALANQLGLVLVVCFLLQGCEDAADAAPLSAVNSESSTTFLSTRASTLLSTTASSAPAATTSAPSGNATAEPKVMESMPRLGSPSRKAASQPAAEESCSIDDTKETKLGVISYWWPTQSYYDTLPKGSLAVINPSNGIFDSTQQDTETLGPNICLYKQVATTAAARGSRLLGYVSTGYFDHSCNKLGSCQTLDRIKAQVEKYFEVFPDLAGIFFDEVAPTHWDCSAFPHEYATLREIVKTARADAKIAFNTGVPDNCVVDGVEAGEILVLYEKDVKRYGATCDSNWEQDNIWWATQRAKNKNIETWHLVHTASESEAQDALKKARHYGVDWFYATEIGGDWQNGENTWGKPPVYWDLLKNQLHTAVTLEVVQELTATLSTDSFGQKILTLKRPSAQCCNRWDWVGLYKKGAWQRVSYLHSYNEFDPTFVLPLDCLVEGAAAGEYDFKYSTSLDGWKVHNLSPTLAIP